MRTRPDTKVLAISLAIIAATDGEQPYVVSVRPELDEFDRLAR